MFKHFSKSELLFGIYVLMKDLRNDYSLMFWERFKILEKFLKKLKEIDEEYDKIYQNILYWKEVFNNENYINGKDVDYSFYLEKTGAINEINLDEIRKEFIIYVFKFLLSSPASIISYLENFNNFKFLNKEV